MLHFYPRISWLFHLTHKHIRSVIYRVLGIIPGRASPITAFLFLKQFCLLIKLPKGHEWPHSLPITSAPRAPRVILTAFVPRVKYGPGVTVFCEISEGFPFYAWWWKKGLFSGPSSWGLTGQRVEWHESHTPTGSILRSCLKFRLPNFLVLPHLCPHQREAKSPFPQNQPHRKRWCSFRRKETVLWWKVTVEDTSHEEALKLRWEGWRNHGPVKCRVTVSRWGEASGRPPCGIKPLCPRRKEDHPSRTKVLITEYCMPWCHFLYAFFFFFQMGWFSSLHSWFYSLHSIGNIFACYFFQILFMFFLSSSLEPPSIWKRGCLKLPHRPLMGLFDLCVCPSFFLSVSFWIVPFAMFSSSFEMSFPKYHFLCHVSSTTNLTEYIFLLSRQSFHRWEFGKGLGFFVRLSAFHLQWHAWT